MNPQPEIIYGGKEEADPEVVMLRMQIEVIQQESINQPKNLFLFFFFRLHY